MVFSFDKVFDLNGQVALIPGGAAGMINGENLVVDGGYTAT